MDLVNATVNATNASATSASDIANGIRGIVDNAKTVIPYEAWMGLAIILSLLVVLYKVPFLGGMMRTLIYILIVVVGVVFGCCSVILAFKV